MSRVRLVEQRPLQGLVARVFAGKIRQRKPGFVARPAQRQMVRNIVVALRVDNCITDRTGIWTRRCVVIVLAERDVANDGVVSRDAQRHASIVRASKNDFPRSGLSRNGQEGIESHQVRLLRDDSGNAEDARARSTRFNTRAQGTGTRIAERGHFHDLAAAATDRGSASTLRAGKGGKSAGMLWRGNSNLGGGRLGGVRVAGGGNRVGTRIGRRGIDAAGADGTQRSFPGDRFVCGRALHGCGELERAAGSRGGGGRRNGDGGYDRVWGSDGNGSGSRLAGVGNTRGGYRVGTRIGRRSVSTRRRNRAQGGFPGDRGI